MIVDLNPRYWNKDKFRRPIFVAFSCFVCFLAALPMVTKGGMYVFQVTFERNLTFDIILDFSCAIHLVHQVYVSFGLRFSKLLLSLGSMAVNAFTMISFLCSVIKWTFERVSWLHLVICGRYGT